MSFREIAPECSFRFGVDDIRTTYGSPEGAFEHGDFLNASQMAPPDSDLKACSLLLGGLLEQGLEALDRLTVLDGRAQLCRAFALWSLNRTAEATAALDAIVDPEYLDSARKFQTLLARDNINVFVSGAILSVFAEHNLPSFMSPSHKYGDITVKYVGSQFEQNAYPFAPPQNFDELINSLPADERPDILFALSPQWLLPRNFHKVSVPKVFWAHDTDAFHYRNAENFALYDVAICNSSQEHFELIQGTPGLFGAANMLLHPLATPFPEASLHREKYFDVIFTGSALAPFHSEKPRFLFNLAELATKYTVKVIEGHLPEKEYFDLISHSKFLPVVNRYAGGPSPRWRDALANGAYLLYPEGTFYSEIAPGCFPFSTGSMVADIERHLNQFNAGTDPAYDSSKVVPEVNKRFEIHREPSEESFQRLLKYALFMALVWPRPQTEKPEQQRRLVWLTPAVDAGLFGHRNIEDRIHQIGAHVIADELTDDIGYNNAGHIHAQLVFSFPTSARLGQWVSRTDAYFREGLSKFPKSLLLQFNEAHWSFFKPNANLAAAEEKFRRLIDSFDNFEFDPYGADVAFAYTLHDRDEVFPCYEYADVATTEMVLKRTAQLSGKKRPPYSTRDIIRSACHGYVGWARLKAGDRAAGLAALKQAMDIFPQGLPLLRLYFDTLLKQYSDAGSFTQDQASDFADAFFNVANVNPSILLTHVFIVVPILADHGERQAARTVLAAWHRLANIVESVRLDDEQKQLSRLAILWDYRSLLPAALKSRIDDGLWDEQAMVNVSQLERWFIEITRTASSETKPEWWIRRPQKPITADHIAQILTETGYRQERVSVSNLRRAVSIWRQVPANVKRVYLLRAIRMIMRGRVKAVLLLIQDWSISSKWSRAAALEIPRRRRWRRLYDLLGIWIYFGRTPDGRG